MAKTHRQKYKNIKQIIKEDINTNNELNLII